MSVRIEVLTAPKNFLFFKSSADPIYKKTISSRLCFSGISRISNSLLVRYDSRIIRLALLRSTDFLIFLDTVNPATIVVESFSLRM